MTPPPPTVKATKEEAKRFLSKAEEFLRAAQSSLREGEPNAASLLSIHAAISACDALTAHYLGSRSSSQRHHDVLNLLRQLPLAKKETLIRQVSRLLDAKNVVEYEDKLLFREAASEMVELAERVVRTSRGVVK